MTVPAVNVVIVSTVSFIITLMRFRTLPPAHLLCACNGDFLIFYGLLDRHINTTVQQYESRQYNNDLIILERRPLALLVCLWRARLCPRESLKCSMGGSSSDRANHD